MPVHKHAISDITLNGSISFDLSLKGYNRYDHKFTPAWKYHHGTVAGTGD